MFLAIYSYCLIFSLSFSNAVGRKWVLLASKTVRCDFAQKDWYKLDNY